MGRTRLGLVVWLCAAACSANKQTPPSQPPAQGTQDAAAPRPLPDAGRVDPVVLLQNARKALDEGDHAAARPLLEVAVQQPNTQREARLLLAQSRLVGDGDARAARDTLEPLLRVTPVDVDAQLLLGQVLEAQGNTAQALDTYAVVTQARPVEVLGWERLASAALTLAAQAQAKKDAAGQKAAAGRAVEAFGKARAAGGDKPAYAMGDARARELHGDLKGAEAALLHLLELNQNAPHSRVMLVDFYERHGMQAKADAQRKAAGTEATPQKRKLRPLKPTGQK